MKWGIAMSVTVKVLNYQEYIAVLNQVTNKLVIFEDVFSEYVKTAKLIIKGRALVDEDLRSLQKYYNRNLHVLQHFAKLVIALPVENDCLILRESLRRSFQQYISATKDLYHALNQENLENYPVIVKCRKKQKRQVLYICQTLAAAAQLPHDNII